MSELEQEPDYPCKERTKVAFYILTGYTVEMHKFGSLFSPPLFCQQSKIILGHVQGKQCKEEDA